MSMLRKVNTGLEKFMRETAGASAIEFGIIFPLMLLMLVVMGDLSTGILLKMELTSAARAGVQHGLVSKPDHDDLGAVETTALNALSNTGGVLRFRQGASTSAVMICQCSDGTSEVCDGTCTSPNYLQKRLTVTATKQWTPMIKYPGMNVPLTLTSSAVLRLR